MDNEFKKPDTNNQVKYRIYLSRKAREGKLTKEEELDNLSLNRDEIFGCGS